MLVDIKHEVLPLPTESEPLFMLLTLDRDKAVFSTLNGHPQKSADDAVEQLRKLYAVNAAKWADYEFNLVLCQTERIEQEIISKVETDPYFCRKFIINVDKLDEELKNLPFVPLSILKEITKRPVSAHSFLVQCGMPAELARHLVIPHTRGIERIIDDCINGDWGQVKWKEFTGETFIKAEAAKDTTQIKLKRLEIEGFRVYREKQDFELDADIIVLFGPNGFGKTSFFDAIDFVCTGGVARLDDRFGRNKKRIIKALKHLDPSVEDCRVSAVLSIDGEDVAIKRDLTDRIKATFDGQLKQRKPTLLKITGLSEEREDIGVDDLVHLFRATHLFGQEFQYLTSEFRKGSTLKEDIISRMLALQDYVQAIDKTEQVTADLTKQCRETSNMLSSREKDISSKRDQLGELQKIGISVDQPKAIDQLASSIAQKVAKQGIDVRDATFNEETMRWWRSLINAKISAIEKRTSIARELVIKHPEYLAKKKDLTEISKRLKAAKKAEDDLCETIKVLRSKLQDANNRCEKTIADEGMISKEKENLEWIAVVSPNYFELSEEIKKQNLIYESTSEKITKLSPEITLKESQYEILKSTIKDRLSQINDLQKQMVDLEGLPDIVDRWQKSIAQEKTIIDDLQSLKKEIEILENDLEWKQKELTEVEQNCNETELKMAILQKSQSGLQDLLSRMEDYVTGYSCPTCGANYASRDELIRRLRERRGEEPGELNRFRNLYNKAKSELAQTKITISEMQIKLEAASQRNRKNTLILEDLRNKKFQYQQKLSGYGILEIKGNSEEITNALKRAVSETRAASQKELEAAEYQYEELEKILAELKDRQNVLLETIRIADATKKSLITRLITIEQQALERKISLNMTAEEIQNKLTEDIIILSQKRKELIEGQNEIRLLMDELQTTEIHEKALTQQTNELTIRIENNNRYIDEIKKCALEFDIEIDAGTDRIQETLIELDHNLIILNRLFQDLSNLEMALNSAEMSISVARINKDKADLEQIVENEKRKLEILNNWNSYFSKVKEDLEQLNSRALEQYTEAYGPLSTSIQKRLRYVYGFGNINLRVEDGSIFVDVEREGHKKLSPSDFFSESQIQIAMFSLFLSANLTQNWSHFCPILLDDPVEHFDDLNSYALVGLIKRLASRGRQFIISTCDEQLYRLMRQQFKTTDNKVIFYKFIALGKGGPMMETY
jgi:exonuclease SbcC